MCVVLRNLRGIVIIYNLSMFNWYVYIFYILYVIMCVWVYEI